MRTASANLAMVRHVAERLGDFLASNDLEDIIAVLDGRKEIVEEDK